MLLAFRQPPGMFAVRFGDFVCSLHRKECDKHESTQLEVLFDQRDRGASVGRRGSPSRRWLVGMGRLGWLLRLLLVLLLAVLLYELLLGLLRRLRLRLRLRLAQRTLGLWPLVRRMWLGLRLRVWLRLRLRLRLDDLRHLRW